MTTYIKSKVYKITARTRPSTTVRGWNGITQPTPSRNGTETQSKRVSSTQTNHSVIWSQRAIRRRHHDGDGHPHGLTMDSHTTAVRGGRGTAAETQSPYKGSRTTAAHKKDKMTPNIRAADVGVHKTNHFSPSKRMGQHIARKILNTERTRT